jgi:hypothetical protein
MDQWTHVPHERANDTHNLGNRQPYSQIQGFSTVLMTSRGMKCCSAVDPMDNRQLEWKATVTLGRVSAERFMTIKSKEKLYL